MRKLFNDPTFEGICMQLNLKKLLSLVATSLVALSTSGFADGDTAQMRNLENRVSALEQRKGASGMINPQGRAQVKDGADLFVYGDLLFWNAHENGLSAAVKNKGSSSNLSNSEVRNVHGKWNLGFRVGIGYNTPHDGWDLKLTWLRFTDNGTRHVRSGSTTFAFPTRVHPANLADDAVTAAGKMRSKWNMRLDQLDFDLGREFFVSKWLTLRPHFGLRSDWIRQALNTNYNNFVGFGAPTLTTIKTRLKDRSFGLGLEGGLDTQWGLGNGWSIFGNLSGAILYGFHHINERTTDKPADTQFLNLVNSFRVSEPIVDLEAGIRWDNMFWNDRFHLGLQIGWEHHVYFSQNQFPVFVDDVSLGSFVANQGDLTLQGWTFAARFDF